MKTCHHNQCVVVCTLVSSGSCGSQVQVISFSLSEVCFPDVVQPCLFVVVRLDDGEYNNCDSDEVSS